ncbi:uncharacterized protein LOC107422326 isoform X1 [Ziziphus jujuba]|uniref:Uncharacterized protein LOC107422326 isoform X1 n=2 Tax=Ziziphus jujuba TaxID=326968 RepID=A0A6P4AMJ2_ZIZJJ|nr:uncharacterized protein LOC107422326 isoform X1 [Ziziphus jujuba]KAH7521553.1 hypothetical protein FEM48_Zijuj07G0045700 [Ziziphus jujuba var. spinosa]
MEAMFVSKKRKQMSSSSSSSFSHPLMGASTRSKSQSHLHCNRSGCTRPDTAKWIRRRYSSRKPNPGCSDGDDVILHAPIKDLRSRRVFSPNSESSMNSGDREFEGEDDGNALKNGGSKKFGDGFSSNGQNVDGKEVAESEGTEKMDLGFMPEAQNLKPIVNSTEKWTQTTPEKHDDSQVKEKPSNGNVQNGVEKVYSGSKTNLGLRPCFQRKVFKNPGSVSYRRLLPYLMGIAENNSSAHKIDQHPKLENVLKHKEFPVTVASQSEEASIKRFNGDMDSMEYQTSHSDALPKIVSDSSNESSSGDKLNLDSPVNTIESPSGVVVDNSWSKPPVNGQIGKMDVEFSCNDEELVDLDRCVSTVVADLHSVKDNVSGVVVADAKPVKNENNDADNGFSCKVQNEKFANINSSSIMDDSSSGKDEELGQYSEDSELGQSHSEVMKIFDKECRSEVHNLNQLEQKYGDESEVLHQIDYPHEESIQMTPPDTEIFDKQDIEENGVDRGEYALHNKDNGLGRPLSGTSNKNATLDDSRKQKVVLNPRSRLKVFKTPGSISYRRLLPFLTNMANNNPGDSANVKPKMDLEEKLVSPTFGSNHQEIPIEKSNDSGFHMECQTCDPGPPLIAALTTATSSFDDKEPSPLSPECSTGFQMPVESGKEQQLQIEGFVADKASKLKASPGTSSSLHGPDLPPILLHPMNCEPSSGEEGALSVSNNLYVDTEADSSRSVMESSDGVKVEVEGWFCPNSSPSEIPISSGLPAVGLEKGILKRNPKGCRGLCTCLNCASFRLHAERSFEFSKNQMEDAKEVALDLIKELSNLRAILEKSAEGADDRVVVHVNKVKEACNKASEAEEQAKIRLNRMSNDLSIHCRIPCLVRPKVRFANNVEQKVIPRTNFLSN